MPFIVSVANGSPIKVTHAFHRVKFDLWSGTDIFNSNCGSILRLKYTSTANDLDMWAL